MWQDPICAVCSTWALTCPKMVKQKPCLTSEMETKLPDSRVSYSYSSVADHRSRWPFLSPLHSFVDRCHVWPYRASRSNHSSINQSKILTQVHVHFAVPQVVMLRFWFFHLDSISIRFLLRIRCQFDFFCQKISYTSPINLGAAMLNYSGEAGEAGDDSERSTSVACRPPIHACGVCICENSAGTPCMGTDQLSDALTAARCVRSEAWDTALYQLWV